MYPRLETLLFSVNTQESYLYIPTPCQQNRTDYFFYTQFYTTVSALYLYIGVVDSRTSLIQGLKLQHVITHTIL